MRIVTVLAIMGLAVQAVPAAEMKFYQLPPNTYPHDVAPAPDGTVWYTAQSAGFLGRFDPEGGKSAEIPLGPHAAPHGVI
ncbi:MAG: lyase, partial [Bradyrhizobiaceae bacterium]|nr:lyase [Bradyrhizobiaceae bacterium]